MITLRPSEDRGHTQLGWLDSRHSFSFDQYFDPAHTTFRSLRVINEDWVAPGAGFPMHPHRDMEIITYILEGALEHKDSMGNGSVIRPGEVQRMSAGTGVLHSEFNASQDERVHLLQIWILPEKMHLAPGYEQKTFLKQSLEGSWKLLAARDARHGALTLHQDAELHAARIRSGEQLSYQLRPGRHAWLQIADGALELDGIAVHAGDGAAISAQESFTLRVSPAAPTAEVLLFDLA
ncbi:MAG: pirin family protein [Acidobacteria bacterium]|nr:pirin family protein [Acidobacteriota bacterium]